MKAKFRTLLVASTITLMTSGCATTGDVERLEKKIDSLLMATSRSSLETIFGEQSTEIAKRIDSLDERQSGRFNSLQQSYASGSLSLQEVRQKMLNLLGNDSREVATDRGIYVRDSLGEKLEAISQGVKIANCRLLTDSQIPLVIKNSKSLDKYSWGVGRIDGKSVVFPWELTMSSFTKEIVEHTARRTAQEFIKMGGEKQWTRPVYISLTLENEDQLSVESSGNQNDIFVTTKKGDAASAK